MLYWPAPLVVPVVTTAPVWAFSPALRLTVTPGRPLPVSELVTVPETVPLPT